MKNFILLLFAALLFTSQMPDSARVNKSPLQTPIFSIDYEHRTPSVCLSSFYELVIYGESGEITKFDEFGNIIIDNDTIAQSCELLDAVVLAVKTAALRTPLQDSAQYYRAEAMFYRQWFKNNSTPNPLTPKPQYRSN